MIDYKRQVMQKSEIVFENYFSIRENL